MINNQYFHDELLDLVNQQDEIIGEVWRNTANTDPSLIHREVGIIIFDQQQRILLQKRAANKKVAPGFWTMACEGHVPKGMSPIEAAHMELKEELGFDTNLTYWDKDLIKLSNETHFTHWFYGHYNDEEIKIDQEEVEEVRWLSEKETTQFIKINQLDNYTTNKITLFWDKNEAEVFNSQPH